MLMLITLLPLALILSDHTFVIFLLLGFMAIVWLYQSFTTVIVTRESIQKKSPLGTTIIKFDPSVKIHIKVLSLTANGQEMGKSFYATVLNSQGKKIKLNSNVIEIGEIIYFLLEIENEVVFPTIRNQVLQKKSVSFGLFQLSPQGVFYKKKLIPYDQIEGFSVEHGQFVLDTSKKRRLIDQDSFSIANLSSMIRVFHLYYDEANEDVV